MAETKLTLEKRVKCVRLFSITKNVLEVCRQMKNLFGSPAPTRKTVTRINKMFDETGSIQDKKRPGAPKRVVTPENRQRVEAELASSPEKSKSVRRLSTKLDISTRSMRRILADMKVRPYHPRLINALTEDDPDRRLQFAEEWLGLLEHDPQLHRKVIWTDESKFHLSGSVNRHNCVYWRPENPHVMIENSNQSPGVMVWGGVAYDGLVGPFFCDGSVTGENYLELLQDTVYPLLEQRFDMKEIWWQQDGAPPHYAVNVRNWLNEVFPERWIGRRGTVEWPARSPDLTPPDFFLWGYLKDRVYRHTPNTIDELKDVIVNEFNLIPVEMCRSACENVALRLQACIDLDGGMVDHAMENRH